jgi:Polysaccharide biosynthesis protein.
MLGTILLFNMFFPTWINFIAKVDQNNLEYFREFIILSVIFFIIRMPFNLFSQLMVFINKAYISRSLDVFAAFFSFISLFLVIHFKLTILHFAFINGILSLLPLIACVVLFLRIWNQNYKSLDANNEQDITYAHLISSSFYFFLNGVGGLILWNTDSFVISHYLGLGSVAEYALLFKFYMILFMIITQLMNVVNPLFPKMLKENKRDMLSNLYDMLLKLFPVLGGLIFIFIFGGFKDFLFVWTHNSNIFIGYPSCFAMGLYCYFLCSSIVPYFVIASLNYAKNIYMLTLLEAILNLILSIILVQRIGVSGVIFATLIAHVCTMFLLVPKRLDKLIPEVFKFNYKYIFRHILLAVLPTAVVVGYINQLEVGYTKIIGLTFVILLYLFMSLVVLGRDDLAKYMKFVKRHRPA